MIHEGIGNLGHLFVIISLVAALYAAFSYFIASEKELEEAQFWKINARTSFIIHAVSVFGIVICLFAIIYSFLNDY